MKRFLLILMLFPAGIFAQSGTIDICSAQNLTNWNTTVWNTTGPALGFKSTMDAKQVIKGIISVIGLKANFEVQSANIPNAAAVVYRGKRYVLYNPDFINKLNAAAGNKWASISVLAHEVGHHLNGHTITGLGSRPDLELDADEFSGFVLRRMGASLKEAQLAMKIAADYKQSLTHPGKQERLVAIAGGWNNADRQITGKGNVYNEPDVAVNTPEEKNEVAYPPTRTSVQSAIDERYILRDVKFAADSYTPYFVTTQYNLVKVVNNQLYLVGKVVKTNSAHFPFAITDAQNQFFIDRNGVILSSSGKRIGVMTMHQ